MIYRAAALFLLACVGAGTAAESSPDLLAAIHSGDLSNSRKLLRDGANANTADTDGTTALMHAVIESDVKMVSMLIEAGADVNASNQAGSTALLYASTNYPMTRRLVSAGANVNAKNKHGATPMTVATLAWNPLPVMRLLIGKDDAVAEGRLLQPVAQKGDLEAIRYLLNLGIPARRRLAERNHPLRMRSLRAAADRKGRADSEWPFPGGKTRDARHRATPF